MSEAKQELHERLTRNAQYIRKIEISWNASDGGPRMDIVLRGVGESILDSWNDEMILGDRGGRTGADMIIGIVKAALNSRLKLSERGNFFLRFSVF